MTRIPHHEMAWELARMVASKFRWLEQHGKNRPEHEVTKQAFHLQVLEQAQRDYADAERRNSERTA